MTGTLTGRHILVVEDEYILARQLVRTLADAGAVVIGPAPSVGRALAMLAAGERVDAAILDVNLAGEKVYPVADELQRRAVPFVFASGYDVDERDPRFPDARYLVKPLTMASLVAAITVVVAG